MHKQTRHKVFTVVELLIVIVIIGILGALILVGWNGIIRSAGKGALAAEAKNLTNQLEDYLADNNQYPITEDDLNNGAGPNVSSDTTVEYTFNNPGYCITVSSNNARTSYYVTSDTKNAQEGTCPGHTGFNGGGGVASQPWTQISLGTYHSCGLSGATPYCWGSNFNGYLGDGTLTRSQVPVNVVTSGALAGRTVTKISAGTEHSCAVANGQAFCWGRNNFGQLGNNSTTDSTTPVAVDTSGVLSGLTVTDVFATGSSFSCAIAGGNPYCWGSDANGRLGNGAAGSSLVPTAVDRSGVLAGRTITKMSVGSAHACVIATGLPFCWGFGSSGRLGNNLVSDQPSAIAVTTSGVLSGRTVTDIAAMAGQTCAIANARAFCWGLGTSGQLGQGTNTNGFVPVAVSTAGVLAGRDLTAISGWGSACVLSTGQVFCWGLNSGGMLGNNSYINSNIPVAVDTSGALSGRTVTQLSSGNQHNCGLSGDNLYCWGSDGDGQLGNSEENATSPVPIQIAAP